jgi:DNA-binding IclR family transcriptional regulator
MKAEVAGTQLLGRAAAVLRAVSGTMPGGLTTAEAAERAALSRPTAYRILTALAANGFLDRDARTSRWVLGPELYLMGAVAAERYDVTELARDSVRELAAQTGESAFFSARRGNETVCLLREEGSFPIRSFVLYEGVRFPLGVASAGLAILAFLNDAAIADYLSTAELVTRFGPQHAARPLAARLRDTRRAGYAVNPGLIVEGSWGMGAAVFDASGSPAWALSLTGIQPRFGPDRQPELGRLLMEHAHRLSQRIQRAAQPTA